MRFFRRKTTIIETIEKFQAIEDSGITFNIYRNNGEVLIQLYKYDDVLNWGLDIDFSSSNGYVLELSFNEAKTDNDENLLRFTSKGIINAFSQFPKAGSNSYFKFIDVSCSSEQIYEDISNVIIEVFGYLPKKVKFDLFKH